MSYFFPHSLLHLVEIRDTVSVVMGSHPQDIKKFRGNLREKWLLLQQMWSSALFASDGLCHLLYCSPDNTTMTSMTPHSPTSFGKGNLENCIFDLLDFFCLRCCVVISEPARKLGIGKTHLFAKEEIIDPHSPCIATGSSLNFFFCY